MSQDVNDCPMPGSMGVHEYEQEECIWCGAKEPEDEDETIPSI